jgi:hypothetical protein
LLMDTTTGSRLGTEINININIDTYPLCDTLFLLSPFAAVSVSVSYFCNDASAADYSVVTIIYLTLLMIIFVLYCSCNCFDLFVTY